MDEVQRQKIIAGWEYYQQNEPIGAMSKQDYKDEFISQMQDEFGGILSQTYGDAWGWDPNVEWDDIENTVNNLIKRG